MRMIEGHYDGHESHGAVQVRARGTRYSCVEVHASPSFHPVLKAIRKEAKSQHNSMLHT